MDGFVALVKGVYEFLNIPLVIWGYTFTFWQIFVAVTVITAACCIIGYFLGGGR